MSFISYYNTSFYLYIYIYIYIIYIYLYLCIIYSLFIYYTYSLHISYGKDHVYISLRIHHTVSLTLPILL